MIDEEYLCAWGEIGDVWREERETMAKDVCV